MGKYGLGKQKLFLCGTCGRVYTLFRRPNGKLALTFHSGIPKYGLEKETCLDCEKQKEQAPDEEE